MTNSISHFLPYAIAYILTLPQNQKKKMKNLVKFMLDQVRTTGAIELSQLYLYCYKIGFHLYFLYISQFHINAASVQRNRKINIKHNSKEMTSFLFNLIFFVLTNRIIYSLGEISIVAYLILTLYINGTVGYPLTLASLMLLLMLSSWLLEKQK